MVSVTKKMLLGIVLLSCTRACVMAMDVDDDARQIYRVVAFGNDPLPAGVDINARDNRGRTALMILLEEQFDNPNLAAVRRLVSEPFVGEPTINPNIADNNGRNALMTAIIKANDLFNHYCGDYLDTFTCEHGNDYLAIAQYLVQHTIDLNARDVNNNYTALMFLLTNDGLLRAIRNQDLVPSGSVDSNFDARQACADRAKNAMRALIEQLLQRGARLDIQNVNGDTALHLAVQSNVPLDILQILLLHSTPAVVNMLNNDSSAALYYAVIGNNLGIVQALVAHGADVNQRYRGDYTTALIVAASDGSEAIVRELLAHGADPELAVGLSTPLMVAAAHPGTIEILADAIMRVHTPAPVAPAVTSAPAPTPFAPPVVATGTARTIPVPVRAISKKQPLATVVKALNNQIKKVKKLEAAFKKEQAKLKKAQADVKKLLALKAKQQKGLLGKKLAGAQKKKMQVQLKRTLNQIVQKQRSIKGLLASIAKKRTELALASAAKNKLVKQKALLEKQARAKKVVKKVAAKKVKK